MAEEKKKMPTRPQNIYLENRGTMSVTGVTDIESFDETTVVLYTDLGLLLVRGEGLHISRIDLESGELSLDGEVQGISYEDGYHGRGGLLAKLFR